MKRKTIVIILLLMISVFADGISCAAKTEDPVWRYYQPDWPWGEREWDTAWGAVRELASDDTGRIPEAELTFTIPEGQEIVELTDFPFEMERNKITEVKLPESLRTIDNYAFRSLRFLKRITIPANVTEVGENIFENCENLREIENLSSQPLPLQGDVYAIEERYYRGPSGLEYYVDGEKVTEVSPGKTAIAREKSTNLSVWCEGDKASVGKEKRIYFPWVVVPQMGDGF